MSNQLSHHACEFYATSHLALLCQDKNGMKKASTDAKACSNCLKPEGGPSTPNLLTCGQCGLVVYCSKECQRAHWKANHKQYCTPKANRAPQHLGSSGVANNGMPQGATDAAEICSICQDPLTGASTTSLPSCAHVFHGTCVAELRKFGLQQLCPLCRAPLLPGPEQDCLETFRRFMVIYRMVERGNASWSTLPA